MITFDQKIIFIDDSPLMNQNITKNILAKSGLDEKICAFMYLRKHLPEGKKNLLKSDIPIIKDILMREFEKYPKRVAIVVCGNNALKLFTGKSVISNNRGILMDFEDFKCRGITTFSLLSVLSKSSNERLIISDLSKLQGLLQGKSSTIDINYINITNLDLLSESMVRLGEVEEFAFDIETTGFSFLKDKIISIAFSWREGTGIVIPLLKQKVLGDITAPEDYWGNDQQFVISKLREVFGNKAKKILHNAKFDLKFIRKYIGNVNNLYFDTMIAHSLLDENAKGMHDLKTLASLYTDMGGYDRPLDDFFKKNKDLVNKFLYLPEDMLFKYNIADADCTYRLYKKFYSLLQQEDLINYFYRFSLPISQVLLECEEKGFKVDLDYLQRLKKSLELRVADLEKKMFAVIGETFNPNSPKQLSKILFDKLKLPVLQYSDKKNPSTGIEVLKQYVEKYNNEFAKSLIEYRVAVKLLGTYVSSLEEALDIDGRIRTSYNMHSAETGRLSTSGYPMQGIPKSDEIRNLFISDKDHSLIEVDVKSAEVRVWASYLKDPILIKELKENIEVYIALAASTWGIPYESISKDSDERKLAKGVFLGAMYGRGAQSIAGELGIDIQKAERVVYNFFNKYKNARLWIDSVKREALSKGKIRSIFGRCRRFPLHFISTSEDRSSVEREAINFPIQSASSDANLLAAVRIMEEVKNRNFKSALVCTVHDSLIFEIPNTELEDMKNIIRDKYKTIEEFLVPFELDFKVGEKWRA